MDRACIIVAGGKGVRMKSERPKQFLNLAGRPLLMHTLEAIYSYDANIQMILVLPESQLSTWKILCKKHDFHISYTTILGGKTRYQSVKNGLKAIHKAGLVAVHDGVRPLVSQTLLDRCFRVAEKKGNAIPCIPVAESLREIEPTKNRRVNRTNYVIIQTPQVFNKELLIAAFKQPYQESFTDEASMIENLEIPVNLVEGECENIKITTPKDLIFAEIHLKNK